MRLKPGRYYKIVGRCGFHTYEETYYGIYIRPYYRQIWKHKYIMKEFKLINGEIYSFVNEHYEYIPITDEELENAKIESL